MSENKPEVTIDIPAMMREIADRTLTEFLASFMPDETSRKMIVSIMSIHRKYGIDAATTLKIIMDLGEAFKEEDPIGEEKV